MPKTIADMTAEVRNLNVDDWAERHYPVIVTVEHVHVIWVQGDDQAHAVENAGYDTHEYLDDSETLVSASLALRKPGDDYHSWDWDTIRDGEYCMPYQGMKHDGAVEAWEHHKRTEKRRAEVAACISTGHPNVEVGKWDMGTYCPTCGWLERTR